MFPYHQAITPAVHHLTYMRSNMATSNTLHIHNQLNDALSITVGTANFNCCDTPTIGQNVGYLVPGGHLDLTYCRTDGHGCNGRQGQFTLELNAGQSSIFLNFDSNGFMSEASPSPNGPNAQVIENTDGTFRLNIYPNPDQPQ
jgi:hypothetical protein